MTASITILPNPCAPNSTVNVHGAGFSTSQKIKLGSGGGVIKIASDGTFDVPMIVPATSGNYTLTIVDIHGLVVATAGFTVGLPPPPPPPPPPPTPTVSSPPTNLVAVAGDASITLNWGTPTSNGGSAITGYKIYRNTLFLTQLSVVTTFVNSGLANGTPYTYTVAAVNSVGDSSMSNSATATPIATPPPDLVPIISAITTSNITGTSARVNWHTSEPCQGWFQYGTTTGYGAESIHETSFNFQDFAQNVSGLSPSTLYNYKIHAVDITGNHVTSANGTFTTTAAPATVPGVPTNFSGTAINATQITLNWAAPTSNGGSVITGYKLYRNGVLLVTLGNIFTYTDGNLINGNTYTYTIAAVNAIGQGPLTTSISVPISFLPLAPPNLVAAGGNSIVTISWG